MDLTCPHCGCTLVAGRAVSAAVFGCASCGGVWLDAAASQQVVTAIDPSFVSLADAASLMATMPFPPHEARPRCPVCRKDMQGVRVDGAALSLDTCNLHGTWFDRGELQSVVRAFAATRKTREDRTRLITAADAHYAVKDDGLSAGDVATSVAAGVAIDVGLGLVEVLFEALLSS